MYSINDHIDACLCLDAGIEKVGDEIRPTSDFAETAHLNLTGKTATGYAEKVSLAGNLMVGCGGGMDRVNATAALFSQRRNMIVVACSQFHGKLLPADHYRVYHEALVKARVLDNNIIDETASRNTIEALINFILLCQEKKWKHAVVVTNSWHEPRVRAFLNDLGTPNAFLKTFRYIIPQLPEEVRERMEIEACEDSTFKVKQKIKSDYFTNVYPCTLRVLTVEEIFSIHNHDRAWEIRNYLRAEWYTRQHTVLLENSRATSDESEKIIFCTEIAQLSALFAAYQQRMVFERRGVVALESGEYGKPTA